MADKLTVVDSFSQKTDLEKAVFELSRNMSAHLEYIRIRAKLQREHYEALIKEGFTDAQALELTKKE